MPSQVQPQMIFVGGLQRSGTTLVGDLLARHSAIAGLQGTPTRENEGQFVQNVYLNDHQLGRRSHQRHARGQAVKWAYHPAAHLTERECAYLGPEHVRQALSQAWQPYFSDTSAPWVVEKSPSNMVRFRFLRTAFPDSISILVRRNPVVQALAVRKWCSWRQRMGLDFTSIVDHWFAADRLFIEDLPYLGPTFLIVYEELIKDPASVLSKVFDFIGVRQESVSDDLQWRDTYEYEEYWDAFSRGDRSALKPLGPIGGKRSLLRNALEHRIAPLCGPKAADEIARRYHSEFLRVGYDSQDLRVFPRSSVLFGQR